MPERTSPPDSIAGRAAAARFPDPSRLAGAEIGRDGGRDEPDEQKAKRQYHTQRDLVIASLRTSVDLEPRRNGQGA